MGGYHPSALPEEVLASPYVELVVRGEGEEAFAELVRSGSPEGVGGVSYRRDGSILHNPGRQPIADLDAVPLPLRELRPQRCGLAGLDYHTDTLYTSRGCRFRCVFCANHLVGGPFRVRRLAAVDRLRAGQAAGCGGRHGGLPRRQDPHLPPPLTAIGAQSVS